MHVCLFEDQGVANLEPLTLTRPVFELLCGQTTLGSKQARHFAPCEVGVLIRSNLVDLFRLQCPSMPVNDLDWLRREPIILVNGRWLPPSEIIPPARDPCVGLVEDEVAYVVVPSDDLTYSSANTIADCLETWKQTLPGRAAGGSLIRYPWDLIEHNSEQLILDFQQQSRVGRDSADPARAGSFALVGPEDRLLLDPTAQIDPLVVADTERGPVVIDREAVVNAFTRLEGPCYVGPMTRVLGGKIRAGTTVGPNCRIGGEVEASIIHGYSNKYHDGFLGHSYVGEWVNLGAGTYNSDLRNDYGEISVRINGTQVATGLTKVGCFFGDHTKTGLGTLINTGTTVGVFCNLLPSATLLPRHVPSFCTWWNGGLQTNYEWLELLETASRMMQRRGCALTEAHAALYRALFDQTALERHRVLQEAQQRSLRRTA
jgi:UDP-N-acetylglucosamine diphosphorylase / glucose-1-phosphate thymidylyltransferase / UDP-N-acetylgalactosamine diphosphorylase / glucosamine-1-phosphate N-acetyltransferase / galactosamine-1-phosphate N-acetyltransferase